MAEDESERNTIRSWSATSTASVGPELASEAKAQYDALLAAPFLPPCLFSHRG